MLELEHDGVTGRMVSRSSTCGPSSKAIQSRWKRSSLTLRQLLLRNAIGEAVYPKLVTL